MKKIYYNKNEETGEVATLELNCEKWEGIKHRLFNRKNVFMRQEEPDFVLIQSYKNLKVAIPLMEFHHYQKDDDYIKDLIKHNFL